jgi:hypothetical protein
MRRLRSNLRGPTHVAHLDRNVAGAAVALHGEAHRLADADLVDDLDQIGEAAHRLAVGRDDHVAQDAAFGIDALKPGAGGGRAG